MIDRFNLDPKRCVIAVAGDIPVSKEVDNVEFVKDAVAVTTMGWSNGITINLHRDKGFVYLAIEGDESIEALERAITIYRAKRDLIAAREVQK